jgi:hypothetical protein
VSVFSCRWFPSSLYGGTIQYFKLNIAGSISHDSRLRQLLEWLLALIGPLGLGLVLIVVFVVAAFLLLPRFVPALRVRKRVL